MVDADTRKLELISSSQTEAAQAEKTDFSPVLSPKALDELREMLRSDETVREFFLLLKDQQLRAQAVEKLNHHLSRPR